jgi:tetratricopeptide (TPR) repeat protein
MNERRTLEEERDLLLAQIRQLDDERAELDDAAYRDLRDGYVSRAASVIRAIDSLGEDAPDSIGAHAEPVAEGPGESAVSEETNPKRSRRRAKVLIGTAGAVVFAVGAGLLVASAMGARQPGQASSGSVPPSPAQELATARQAMAAGDQLDALKLYNAVLAVEPNQPEALAYRGWLLRLAGDARKDPNLIAQALASEKAAVASDPQYPDARFFLGLILLDDEHDAAAAVPQLEAYLASNPGPQVSKTVQPILERARQEAASG